MEVIFNDWGVGKLLEEKYPTWNKRIGRTLDKMIREPRLERQDYENMNRHVLQFMQEPACMAEQYVDVLKFLNIQGIELDNVPQGYGDATELFSNVDLPKSLYFPFYHVTSGRLCMMKAIGKQPEDKWNLDEPCAHLCQSYNQVMQKFVLNNGKQKKLKLLRKGNAIFGYNTDTKVLELDIWDRLVWQPQIPL